MFITLFGARKLFWERPNVRFVLVFYPLRSHGAAVRARPPHGADTVLTVLAVLAVLAVLTGNLQVPAGES